MRQRLLTPRPPISRHLSRGMPAGAGFVIAALASLLLFALIVGIAAIV